MFIAQTLEDTISVPPAYFGRELKAIKKSLVVKYSNKVLPDVGLCVCLLDIVKLGDAFVFHGDGAPWIRVTFRVVVFRPCIGEVLIGTLTACDAEGAHVTLGFFDNVFIPASFFRSDAVFDREHGLWKWEYKGYDLWFALGEKILFRVGDIEFQSPQQHRKVLRAPLAAAARKDMETKEQDDPDVKKMLQEENQREAEALNASTKPIFQIFGRVDEDGLGMASWW